MMSSSIY